MALPLAASSPPLRAQDAPEALPPTGVALTVYSSADPAGFDPQRFLGAQRQGVGFDAAAQVPGFGVVKEVRDLDLPGGTGTVAFDGVARFVDPTTVSFADLTSPDTAVLEQSFRFDLAGPDKILERYVGRTVAHETIEDGVAVGRVEGRVLSVNQGTVVLEVPGQGLRFVPSRDPGLRLAALPEGLLLRPTLLWKVATPAAGRHRVRTTYQTSGLTWRADYNLVLDAAASSADVAAWVTLLNVSGASWRDVRLKLVAGDVQRLQPPVWGPLASAAPQSGGSDKGHMDAFEEKAFFEYHLYTLPRPTDVPDAATQQIPLFPPARGVAVQKRLVYDGLPEAASWGVFPEPRRDRDVRSVGDPKVDVHLRWRNGQANRMGMPLPKGKVRVFQLDPADATLEFLGEDLIDHTARDEEVDVRLGQAFDVVGERVQTDFGVDASTRTMTDEYRIVLRNHKDVPVTVVVREHLFRWTNWTILAPSDPLTKVDAATIQFEVEVAAHGERAVAYAVRYAW